MPKTIGVISDTHGLLRVEALAALRGCDAIVHAGGEVVVAGTPEDVARCKASHTGRFLKPHLRQQVMEVRRWLE